MEVTETPVVTVMKDILRPDRVLETHASTVFIKDDFVYKVKKSVDFGFLDYSSKKKRKAMCIVEKDLNERFCDGIYLEVLKIARLEKAFKLVPFDSSLLTLDYCLKMKRIPDECFLSCRLANGMVSVEDAVNTGKNIAKLFKDLSVDKFAAEFNGSAEVVSKNCVDNFNVLNDHIGKYVDNSQLNYIKSQTEQFISQNGELLDSRVKDGLVLDGHGDLRLEHVFIDGDQFGLIDCIEFNKSIRYNDVVSEIAFLCMEADMLGETAVSDGLLDGFLSVFDDENSLKLINFYKTYRAMVRAKVACLLLSEKDEEWEHYKEKRAEIDKYMNMAMIYSLNMFETESMIFYGLMASGKSRNARIFSEVYPVEHVNTDVVRKLMHGVDPDSDVHVDFGAELYSAENSQKLYEYLGELAENNRRIGRMTLIDGSFSKNKYIDFIEKEYKGRYVKIRFHAPEDVIMDRLEKRREKVTASDGRPEIYEQQKASAEEIGEDFSVETTASSEENADRIIGYLIDKK